MKKTKKIIPETQINVKDIMKHIEEEAKKRRLAHDLALLDSIDIRKLEITDSAIASLKKDSRHSDDESFDHNLHSINTHYSLIDKYRPFSSDRKGIFRTFANILLKKHFDKTKMFLENIFSAQEMFNVRVVRIFNALVKEIASFGKKLNEQHDILHAHTEKVATEFSHFRTAFKTYDENLSNQSQSLVDSVKQELEQKLETKLNEIKKSILYPPLEFDYKKFQDRFRGSQQAILQNQKQYLRFFHECKNVMDIGCGRGEFIEMLHQNGIGAFGVEIDPDMVRECRAKSLNVADIDVVSYLKIQLERETPDSIDGIFSAQVIEHLYMDYLIEMLRLCYRILQPDRFIVLETINVKCLTAFTTSIYLDPTHVKPIHPETLQFILESLGFREIAFLFSSEFSDEIKLHKVEPHCEQDTIYNQNVKKLNELLFAPQDYAIIAKK